MNTDKLKVGDFGDDVTRLHENLKTQGFSVSPEEERRKFFGPATRETIWEFQKQHQLEVTGAVDQKTALALQGIIANAGPPPPAVVAPVSANLQAPLHPADIVAIDTTPGISQAVALTASRPRFAVRTQSTTISLKPGEVRTYRLPTMTPGVMHITASRVSLPTGPNKPGDPPD